MKIQTGCISDKEIMSPTDGKLDIPRALVCFPTVYSCHEGAVKEMCTFPVIMT